MTGFSGEVALVTGGASGIGEAVAHRFGQSGAAVVVADIDGDGAEATAGAVSRETEGTALAVETDVTDSDSVAALVETTVEEFGGLDAAVNSAGIAGGKAPTADYPDEEFERIVDVNLTGVWRSCKYELQAMYETGGAIVNVSSVFGRSGYKHTGAYVAAKHGVVGVTKTAALEYAEEDIRVNAVCPGFTETGMLDDAGVNRDERTREYTKGLHAMDRFGDPEEIADAIVWLCSADASFVTGTAVPVDGGYLID